ncbi:unnamed protein product [Vicia faba]|uniref:Uncharacterized protein n=1 Tax=Vicia faba TaxID=3906 RepID=A0AAV0ZL52_VICFA|nr:unnamed protein product [Vicia faba]
MSCRCITLCFGHSIDSLEEDLSTIQPHNFTKFLPPFSVNLKVLFIEVEIENLRGEYEIGEGRFEFVRDKFNFKKIEVWSLEEILDVIRVNW